MKPKSGSVRKNQPVTAEAVAGRVVVLSAVLKEGRAEKPNQNKKTIL
jgi:hypothetical protein